MKLSSLFFFFLRLHFHRVLNSEVDFPLRAAEMESPWFAFFHWPEKYLFHSAGRYNFLTHFLVVCVLCRAF